MNSKTLLVLAASRYQVPIIVQAKQLGLRVITTDNVPDNPGHILADRAYGVDTTDMKGVLNIARKEHINGVIAACTDVALPTAAYVSEKLGMRCMPFQSTQICCDKVSFRSFLKSLLLPVPEVYTFSKDTEPPHNIFSSQWVMKPARSSGSKGVFVVSSFKEFYSHRRETLSYSLSGNGILETFIDGSQGTCEGVIQNGKVVWHIVTDRQTAPQPYAATHGHCVPSRITEDKSSKLIGKIEKLLTNLDIIDSVFDCDFICTRDSIYIIEISPRLGGNSMTTLIRHACGFDIIDYAVRLACELPTSMPDQNKSIAPTALVLLGVMKEGSLKYDDAGAKSLRLEPWVHGLEIDRKPNEIVYPFINGRFRIGEAIISADSRDDLDLRIIDLKARLNLRVQ